MKSLMTKSDYREQAKAACKQLTESERNDARQHIYRQFFVLPEFIKAKTILAYMGCQHEIAEKIISKEADYILAVKGNQGSLEENIEDTVRFTASTSDRKEEDFGHGRIESRHYYLYKDLSFVENAHRWKSLAAVVKIESTRYIKSTGKTETNNQRKKQCQRKKVDCRVG